MKSYIGIIKEVAEEATNTYCAETGCAYCEFEFYETCHYKLKTTLVKTLITELAIERVKEKVNESKD